MFVVAGFATPIGGGTDTPTAADVDSTLAQLYDPKQLVGSIGSELFIADVNKILAFNPSASNPAALPEFIFFSALNCF